MIHCIREDPLVGQRSGSRSQTEVSGSSEGQRPSDDFDDGGKEDRGRLLVDFAGLWLGYVV